ncbi:MAG: SGNH/GDSL hydrolase family protein [Rhodomicrobiaceae bacterium]
MSNTAIKKKDEPAASKGGGRPAALLAGAVIATLSVAFSLVVAEAGYRLGVGVPLLEASNWRVEGIRTKRIGDRAMTDDRLGWTLKPHYKSSGFNTIDHGIRRNFDETEVRTGGVLAVGDSFTEGFDEVTDEGTWPAHLEEILGEPVINAGVAGYAADQILLRAEDMLALIKPQTLIIGFTEVDIYRSALSEAGAPKPYFTIENDELVYHPPGPFEPREEENPITAGLRSVLGYSALGDHLFSRLTPSFWYPQQAAAYREIENEPLKIICRLLEKTKNLSEAQDVRLLVFLQYAGDLVLEEPGIIDDMKHITKCAQETGIQVVDQFASLKALTKGDVDLVAEYYVVDQNEEYGHMSPKGNHHAAQLLAEALDNDDETPPLSTSLEEKSKPVPN